MSAWSVYLNRAAFVQALKILARERLSLSNLPAKPAARNNEAFVYDEKSIMKLADADTFKEFGNNYTHESAYRWRKIVNVHLVKEVERLREDTRIFKSRLNHAYSLAEGWRETHPPYNLV